EPFILAALLFVTVLHALAAANRLTAQYGLAAFQVMLFGAFMYCNVSHGQPRALSHDQSDLLASIPDDIRTVLALLDLEPNIVRYAAC
ncbi:uncharacterized protein TRAVEDRAFT_106892, partial [Trametes versicolor FP-101664 SS1]|uniref:uncharacterized protein n=1 Tax=Trametes versicolor (strain FP-101664) TaxID=717944 RepID=UPI0004621CE4